MIRTIQVTAGAGPDEGRLGFNKPGDPLAWWSSHEFNKNSGPVSIDVGRTGGEREKDRDKERENEKERER